MDGELCVRLERPQRSHVRRTEWAGSLSDMKLLESALKYFFLFHSESTHQWKGMHSNITVLHQISLHARGNDQFMLKRRQKGDEGCSL